MRLTIELVVLRILQRVMNRQIKVVTPTTAELKLVGDICISLLLFVFIYLLDIHKLHVVTKVLVLIF